jgi:ubiquinone biosynthesis monooxygenase Coq6
MPPPAGSNPLTRGLRVAVLDREFPPPEPFCPPPIPGLRVSTLTPASAQLLAGAGAWQHLAPPRVAPFHDMEVWDAGGGGFMRFNAHALARGAMGWVAENAAVASALAREVRAPGSNVELLEGCGIAAAALPPYRGALGGELAALRLEGGGREVRARLVVGADGAGARVRQLAGIRTRGREYGQRGVVATVSTAGEPNATAWQRFLPTGPLALLPVRDGFSNVVWTTTPQHAAALEAASPAEFGAAVNAALTGGAHYPPRGLAGALGPLEGLARMLGGGGGGGGEPPAGSIRSAAFVPPPMVLECVGPAPRSFPLVLRHAGRYVRPRVALVGDAAHAVHPLAGQGVNLGLGDVRALVQAIADAGARVQRTLPVPVPCRAPGATAQLQLGEGASKRGARRIRCGLTTASLSPFTTCSGGGEGRGRRDDAGASVRGPPAAGQRRHGRGAGRPAGGVCAGGGPAGGAAQPGHGPHQRLARGQTNHHAVRDVWCLDISVHE